MSNGSASAGLRAEVAALCGALAGRGLVVGTAGNVSARAGDRIAVTPTGADLATLTADAIPVVDLDGTVVEGTLRPTSELALHLGIYRSDPDGAAVGGVVHTHSPMATTLSTVLTDVPVIHYQQLLLGGGLRVAPFHAFGTPELADAVRTALRERQAALMANHGAVAVGATVRNAFDNAVLTEWVCGLLWRALSIGTPRVLSDEQQAAVVEAAIRGNYGDIQEASWA